MDVLLGRLQLNLIKYLEDFSLALVETSLEFYDLIFEDNPNKSKETIAFEFRKYQPWLYESSVEYIKSDRKIKFESRVEDLAKNGNKYTNKEYINVLKNSVEKKIGDPTIAIDEAHILTESHTYSALSNIQKKI